MTDRIIKGTFIHTPTPQGFEILAHRYVLVIGGRIREMGTEMPAAWPRLPLVVHDEGFIIPGFVDLHLHAPQYDLMGLGMDRTLLDWLRDYTFPAESAFADTAHAMSSYIRFAKALVRNGTTSAAVFGTTHLESTLILVDVLREHGIGGLVGKVNMDRDCPPALLEDTADSLAATVDFIERGRFGSRLRPVLTPRFAPACSPALLEGLGGLARRRGLPVQSHLCENLDEISLVRQLFPEQRTYAEVYDRYGLFGQTPTLMAHAIHLEERDLDLAARNRVTLVHCPLSNLNLASGMMPVRRLLDRGIRLGLGSDIAAGNSLFMPHAIVSAVQTAKVQSCLYGDQPLSLAEAFYLATKGGGDFLGAVGSFEPGRIFDALVITGDEALPPQARLEKFLYCGTPERIAARYVGGEMLMENGSRKG